VYDSAAIAIVRARIVLLFWEVGIDKEVYLFGHCGRQRCLVDLHAFDPV
jgi:hypothetical protein